MNFSIIGIINLILVGGKIFTGNPEKLWTQGIAIEGNKIRHIGSREKVLEYRTNETRIIELEGHTVVPGFNDSHTHFTPRNKNSPLIVNASSTSPTLDEIKNILVSNLNQEVSILLGAVDAIILDDVESARKMIDDIAPSKPVGLLCWSGHGSILNKTALEKFNISNYKTDPIASRIGRKKGKITGWIAGYLDLQIRFVRDLNKATIKEYFESVAYELTKLGITSIQCMPFMDPFTLARAIKDVDLPIRIRIMNLPLEFTDLVSIDRFIDEMKKLRRELNNHDKLTISGIKWFVDGSPVERNAYMQHDYADKPGWKGMIYLNRALLENIISGSLKHSEQLLFHAVGDLAILELLHVLDEQGSSETWQQRRVRIEHGDFLLPETITQVEKMGVIIVQNPSHLTLTDLFKQRFMEIKPTFQPLKSILARKIPLAFRVSRSFKGYFGGRDVCRSSRIVTGYLFD